jgi:hypothetical protein
MNTWTDFSLNSSAPADVAAAAMSAAAPIHFIVAVIIVRIILPLLRSTIILVLVLLPSRCRTEPPCSVHMPSLRASLGRKLGHIMAAYVDGFRP